LSFPSLPPACRSAVVFSFFWFFLGLSHFSDSVLFWPFENFLSFWHEFNSPGSTSESKRWSSFLLLLVRGVRHSLLFLQSHFSPPRGGLFCSCPPVPNVSACSLSPLIPKIGGFLPFFRCLSFTRQLFTYSLQDYSSRSAFSKFEVFRLSFPFFSS